MSDIKNLHRAYAAVYDSEIKENLKQSRDEISEMSLTQMNDVDLYEVAEEVLEEVFAKNSDIVEAEKLIEAVFRKASEGVESEGRADKIERLGEAFESAFARVKEKSIRTAVESYSDYRRGKEIIANRNDDPNSDLSKVRLHNALVAEDRRVVKDGLLKMIESIGSAIDKTLGAAGEVADTAIKLPAKGIGYLKGLKKGIKKAAKEGESKASSSASPKNEAYTVTRADKEGKTPAYLGWKAGKKNVKTGEPLYQAADHLKKEELEASGLFSEHEINAIVEAERSLADRLARKRKLYDKTTKKAMQFARDEGEASGHARWNMSRLGREMDKVKDKMNEK